MTILLLLKESEMNLDRHVFMHYYSKSMKVELTIAKIIAYKKVWLFQKIKNDEIQKIQQNSFPENVVKTAQ